MQLGAIWKLIWLKRQNELTDGEVKRLSDKDD
jgi:hypothetical protein